MDDGQRASLLLKPEVVVVAQDGRRLKGRNHAPQFTNPELVPHGEEGLRNRRFAVGPLRPATGMCDERRQRVEKSVKVVITEAAIEPVAA